MDFFRNLRIYLILIPLSNGAYRKFEEGEEDEQYSFRVIKIH